MPSLLVMNGPNLNLLGTREPEIYGSTTLADVEKICREHGSTFGAEITFMQSNHEGELIEALHNARGVQDGVIFNAGAFTHTSIALHDAIVASELPVVEVHISNVHAREAFRHKSVIAPVSVGQVVGFGIDSYVLAIDALTRRSGTSQ